MNSSVDIIIVNWNAGRQLYECLKSIQDTASEHVNVAKVIVIDNASTDDSLEGLTDLDIPLKVIRNKMNRGFGAACNQGALESTSDYVLFLNPDTILFEESLRGPLKVMNEDIDKELGVCSIQLIDEKGNTHRSCCRFPTVRHFLNRITGLATVNNKLFSTHFMTDWDHKETAYVDHVIGAFYFIRTELFKKLNGFDERFFVYMEDLDLSYRVAQTGKKILYLAEYNAFHKGGGTSEQVRATRLFYSIRSRLFYIMKHYRVLPTIVLLLATLVIEPISRVALAAFKRSISDVKEVFKAYTMLIKDMSNIMRVSK